MRNLVRVCKKYFSMFFIFTLYENVCKHEKTQKIEIVLPSNLFSQINKKEYHKELYI